MNLIRSDIEPTEAMVKAYHSWLYKAEGTHDHIKKILAAAPKVEVTDEMWHAACLAYERVTEFPYNRDAIRAALTAVLTAPETK